MKTNPTNPQQARSLIQALAVCALASVLAVAIVWRTRAQTASTQGTTESENLDAVLAELLSKPIPPYTRAFDRLAGLVSSNELQTLSMRDSRELEARLEKLKTPEEKHAEKLSLFAIMHPAEFAAAMDALAPARERAPEEMSDPELAMFATTNTAQLSQALAARVKTLSSLEAMRQAAQSRLDASPPPDTGELPAPMVPMFIPKDSEKP